MIYPLTRKLLRDWKKLNYQSCSKYHIKPQDSNLHVWHCALVDETTGYEVYVMIFVGGENEPVTILRCFTPNASYPINRNICMSYLASIISNTGLVGLLDHLSYLFFDRHARRDSQYLPENCEPSAHFSKVWNRTMLKDFNTYFPELYQQLEISTRDREMIQQWLNKNTYKSNVSSPSTVPSFKFTDTSFVMACDETQQQQHQQQHFKKQRTVNGHVNTREKPMEDGDHELHRKRRR